jgi:hypothetical protein
MTKFTNHIDHVAWISRPEDLEANVAVLEKLADGWTTIPFSPWRDKLVLWERMAGMVMHTCFTLGDIDHAHDVIPFGEA